MKQRSPRFATRRPSYNRILIAEKSQGKRLASSSNLKFCQQHNRAREGRAVNLGNNLSSGGIQGLRDFLKSVSKARLQEPQQLKKVVSRDCQSAGKGFVLSTWCDGFFCRLGQLFVVRGNSGT
jgi:hypothetical protein